jgi:hypothetical protein
VNENHNLPNAIARFGELVGVHDLIKRESSRDGGLQPAFLKSHIGGLNRETVRFGAHTVDEDEADCSGKPEQGKE